MRFLVLGPLEVVDDGRAVVVAGRRRAVLGLLLAHAGRAVSLDHLVDAVWDGAPPATARRQIQNDVAALRREIPIAADGRGYRIQPRPGELDAQVFADLVAEALDLAARGEPAAAAAGMRSALGLWRGPALTGLPGRAVEAAAGRLEEERLAALEHCFDLELGLGRHRELVGELVELVATHPLRERLVGQLMLALHGSGRQPEALAAYDRLRRHLAGELGLEPGTALRDLHGAILRDDLTPGPRRETPAQLPPDVSGFTGRAEQLRRLDGLLPEPPHGSARAVVISAIAGTAGVGKTALAVHWGHRVRDRFPDGQLYLNLRGFSAEEPVRPVEALAHLLRSLGEPAERIPVDVQTAAGRFRSLLADRRMLVVLDNAADADQVRPLLPAGAGCFALVTSRNRLTGLLARDGATGLTLDVLAPDEAHALLAAVLGAERVAAEPDATAELARICSHLPLALRVAAAGLTGHPWPGIAAFVAALRAGDRLAALDVDGDEHSGVRRAFDLSYRMVHPDARRMFRLLGLVPGPDVTVEAAASLAGTGAADARRRLDRLVTAHLVDHAVLGRYTCHDLLRHYAADRCRAEETAAEREAALRRLHDWYLDGADRAARTLYGTAMRLPSPGRAPTAVSDEATALGWLDAERTNLVAAIRHAADHGPRPVAWLLADALRGYFWLGMHTVEWQVAASAALAAAEAEGDPRAQASAQLSLGDFHFRQGRSAPAIERYAAALSLAERAGWAECEAAATGNLGVNYRDLGRLRHAVEHLDRGLKLARANGWRHGEAVTLDALARTYLQMGRLSEAHGCCVEALAINRAIGSRLGEATTLGDLGEVLYAEGRLDEAVEHLTGALPLFRELGDRTNEVFSLRVLAAARSERGADEEAAEWGDAALALARELGEPRIEAEALATLGALAHRTGRHREAARRYEEARKTTDEPYVGVEVLIGSAAECLCLGDRDRALDLARRAVAIAREAEYRLLEDRAQAVVDRVAASMRIR